MRNTRQTCSKANPHLIVGLRQADPTVSSCARHQRNHLEATEGPGCGCERWFRPLTVTRPQANIAEPNPAQCIGGSISDAFLAPPSVELRNHHRLTLFGRMA